MNSQKSAVFRGIAAILAFLMLVTTTVANLTFQYDSWLNTNIFGIQTSYVVGGDTEATTYYANDYGYDDVFARQAEGHLTEKDVFIGISTSGNSENVYRAVLKAQEIGAKTACLAGKDGGKIGRTVDYPIIVPSNVTARVQECHICIIHILCEISEAKLSSIQTK